MIKKIGPLPKEFYLSFNIASYQGLERACLRESFSDEPRFCKMLDVFSSLGVEPPDYLVAAGVRERIRLGPATEPLLKKILKKLKYWAIMLPNEPRLIWNRLFCKKG